MVQLTVETTTESYEVFIQSNAYHTFKTHYETLLNEADRIVIIADEAVAALHLTELTSALQFVADKVHCKTIPAGEKAKTMAVYSDCQSYLLQTGCTRNSIILAFGGGATGDLAGFVAASFMRGIRYIQCPTTILAHDSAVGGKTAINMPEGKNMVGAFHQPSAVLFQTGLFQTLPPREIRSGLAELLKHALISDEQWAMTLLAMDNFIQPTERWLSEELLKGIAVKAQIVGQDEFEQSTRKYLNFGHTFGHAVEAACNFGDLSHGEAVMIGMAYSLQLSELLGHTTEAMTDQLIQFMHQHKYTFEPIFETPFEAFLAYMEKDKKVTRGDLNFVLLNGIGYPFVKKISREQCEEAFERLKQRTE